MVSTYLSVEHLHTIASHILHNTNSHMFNHNSSCYVRNEPAHMYRRGYETLSFRSSKFRDYDPLTTTRVHTQFKLHRQLRVDHAVVVNTGSRHVYALLNRSCSCGKCENMERIRNSRFTRAVLLTFAINSDTFQA